MGQFMKTFSVHLVGYAIGGVCVLWAGLLVGFLLFVGGTFGVLALIGVAVVAATAAALSALEEARRAKTRPAHERVPPTLSRREFPEDYRVTPADSARNLRPITPEDSARLFGA